MITNNKKVKRTISFVMSLLMILSLFTGIVPTSVLEQNAAADNDSANLIFYYGPSGDTSGSYQYSLTKGASVNNTDVQAQWNSDNTWSITLTHTGDAYVFKFVNVPGYTAADASVPVSMTLYGGGAGGDSAQATGVYGDGDGCYGGIAAASGAGGGGGDITTASVSLTPGAEYSTTVGAGGTGGNNGKDTRIYCCYADCDTGSDKVSVIAGQNGGNTVFDTYTANGGTAEGGAIAVGPVITSDYTGTKQYVGVAGENATDTSAAAGGSGACVAAYYETLVGSFNYNFKSCFICAFDSGDDYNDIVTGKYGTWEKASAFQNGEYVLNGGYSASYPHLNKGGDGGTLADGTASGGNGGYPVNEHCGVSSNGESDTKLAGKYTQLNGTDGQTYGAGGGGGAFASGIFTVASTGHNHNADGSITGTPSNSSSKYGYAGNGGNGANGAIMLAGSTIDIPTFSLTVVKTAADSQVSNVSFKLAEYDSKEDAVADPASGTMIYATTDENGHAVFTGLYSDKFYIVSEENVPDRYSAVTISGSVSGSVAISSSVTEASSPVFSVTADTQINFNNELPATFSLTVVKTASDNQVSNIQFKLAEYDSKEDAAADPASGTMTYATTDENGHAVFSGLSEDKVYIVSEVNVSDRYHEVTISGPVSGNVTINSSVTEASSEAFSVTADTQINFNNELPATFSLTVVKTASDNQVSNIQFKLAEYDSKEDAAADPASGTMTYATTDENGHAVFSGLSEDKVYIVSEENVSDRYHEVTISGPVSGNITINSSVTEVSSEAFSVTADTQINFSNAEPDKFDLTVVKTATDNQIAGVSFKLAEYNSTSEAESNPASGTMTYATTDENGHVVFEDLRSDKVYIVSEENVPDRYRTVVISGAASGNVTVDSSVTEVSSSVFAMTADTQINFSNELPFYSVAITKSDKTIGASAAQGDATLAGAVYTVYAGENVYVKNPTDGSVTMVGKDGEVMTITTDTNGTGTGAMWLAPGSYYLKETTAPNGYNLSTDVYNFTVSKDSTSSTDGSSAVITFSDPSVKIANSVITGKITVHKANSETGDNSQFGNTDLSKISVELINNSGAAVYINGTSYANGDVIDTKTLNASGETSFENLPYGTYLVKEFSAENSGFTLGTENSQTVKVTVQDGNTDVNFADTPIRGNITFKKYGETNGTCLANVVFVIESATTGEKHVVVTDSNGKVDTADLLKNSSDAAAMANANDSAVDWSSKTVTGTLDSSAPVWFYGNNDDKAYAIDTTRGALPYDTYYVTEYRCDGNKGYDLCGTSEFTISENQKTVELGGFYDFEMPKLSTTLATSDGQKNIIADSASATLIDTISITNLKVGTTYYLVGKLVDKATGNVLKDASGNDITVTGDTFTVTSKDTTKQYVSGNKSMEFNVGKENLVSGSIVAYEYLYQVETDGAATLISTHENLSDAAQTVVIVGIKTTAASEDGLKHVLVSDASKIVDTVTMSSLESGTSYQLVGELMTEENGIVVNVTTAKGNPVKSTLTFTADASSTTQKVTFSFDGTDYAGKKIVVFETLYDAAGTTVLAQEQNFSNADQTVYLPKVGTEAEGKTTQNKLGIADAAMTVTDTVTYSGIMPGSYVLTGELYNKATGEVVTGSTTTMELTVTESSGSADMDITVDTTNLKGATLVVFETITQDGKTVAAHTDINSEEQTIYVPQLKTDASDGSNNKEIYAKGTVTIVDTVTYANLVADGSEYTVKGQLFDKDSGEVMTDAEGNTIESETTFIPDSASGTVDVTFTVSADIIAGHTGVAAESLYYNGILLAQHNDLNDEQQTFTVPRVTTAVADANGSQETMAAAETKFTDAVTYQNLKVGAEYTVTGTLMYVNDDGIEAQVLDGDGHAVTSTVTFAPTTADGTVDVEFQFDATDYAGKDVVVFEQIADSNGRTIAVDDDITNTAETMSFPWIDTYANGDSTSNKIVSLVGKTQITVTDTVKYKNLTVGKTYVLKAVLMDQSTSEPVTYTNSDGNEVTAEAVMNDFVPASSDGTQQISVTIPVDAVNAGTVIVCYETLHDADNDTIIYAEHKDIEDAEQTIYVPAARTSIAAEDGTQTAEATKEVSFTDTITYAGLQPSMEYSVKGYLVNKATGETYRETKPEQLTAATVETQLLAGEYTSVETDEASVTEVTADIINPDYEPYLEKYYGDFNHDGSINDTDLLTGLALTLEEEGDTVENLVTSINKMIEDTPDEYVVTATFTPEEASGTTEVTFTVNGNQTGAATFVAYEEIYLDDVLVAEHKDLNDTAETITLTYSGHILKTDASDQTPLAGAKIALTDETEGFTRLITTDSDGKAYFAVVPQHEYSYVEVEAPRGYNLNNTLYRFTADENGEIDEDDVTLINVKTGSVVITKTDAVNKTKYVAGATVEVYLSTDLKNPIYTAVTDQNGKIYFDPEPYMEEQTASTYSLKFMFKETQAPDGYYLNTDTFSFTVDQDGKVTGTTSFRDAAIGTVVLKKTDESGNPLQGADFAVYTEAGVYMGRATTGSTGRIYFPAGAAGRYYFVEEAAPTGYDRNTDKHWFTIDESGVVTGETSLKDTKSGEGVKTGDNNELIKNAVGFVITIAVAGIATYAAVFFGYRKKAERP